MRSDRTSTYVFLFLLRIGLGWLFLHEGLTKLLEPNWSSFYYMQKATGPLQEFLIWISSDPEWLKFIDSTVVFLLIASGVLLILGLFERLGAGIGMLLLAMFYLAYPPFGSESPVAEGNYFIVDKNLILFLALLVVIQFRSGLVLGLDYFFRKKYGNRNF